MISPIVADGQAALVAGVTAVKTLVDTLLTDASASVPTVTGDALTAATLWLEAKLPPTYAGILTMFLSGAEAAEQPTIAAEETKIQVLLALVKTDADTFLEKYGAPA